MMITFRAVPFDRGSDGLLLRGRAEQAQSPESARLLAETMAASHLGAMAFKSSVNAETGAEEGGVMIASYGEVDDGPLKA